MGEPLLACRQGVGLLVVDHLQAMFERAQKAIGVFQFGGRLGRDPLLFGQRVKHDAGLLATQVAVAAACDQLLRLHEELDFAYAAPSELDVMTRDRDGAMPADRVDLALHRVNVVNGREVEILAPDIGRKQLEETRASLEISRHRARLDEGGALPVLASALIIIFGRRQGHGDGRAAGIGAQAQIGTENITVLGALLKQLDERLGETNEKFAVVEPVLQRQLSRFVEDDEIYIARIIEFARPVLAHAENGKTAALGAYLIGCPENLATARGIPEQPFDAGLYRGIGKGGECRRHAFERPGGGEIGHGDQQRRFGLGKPESARQPGPVGQPGRIACAGDERLKGGRGRGVDQRREPAGMKADYARQER